MDTWVIIAGLVGWLGLSGWMISIVRSGTPPGWRDVDDPATPECIGSKPGLIARQTLSCKTCDWRHTCTSLTN